MSDKSNNLNIMSFMTFTFRQLFLLIVKLCKIKYSFYAAFKCLIDKWQFNIKNMNDIWLNIFDNNLIKVNLLALSRNGTTRLWRNVLSQRIQANFQHNNDERKTMNGLR